MDGRDRIGFGIIGGIVVVIIAGFVLLRSGVLDSIIESDYRSSPISVGFEDGVRVFVEPGDEFEIGLHAHPTEPALAWVVAATDPAVVETIMQNHEQRGAEFPDEYVRSFMSERLRDLWTSAPDPDRPPDFESEDEGSFWLWPHSYFAFSGKDFGTTTLVLELREDGEVLDWYEFEVSVVDDACQYFEHRESLTMVPHRCG
jgi:hypothetical protein